MAKHHKFPREFQAISIKIVIWIPKKPILFLLCTIVGCYLSTPFRCCFCLNIYISHVWNPLLFLHSEFALASNKNQSMSHKCRKITFSAFQQQKRSVIMSSNIIVVVVVVCFFFSPMFYEFLCHCFVLSGHCLLLPDWVFGFQLLYRFFFFFVCESFYFH